MRITDGQIYVGELPVARLAAQFGTPLYCLDADSIETRFQQFLGGVNYRPLHIHYACKANANVRVMRFLRGLAAELDACSPGDLAFADAAGFDAERIFYTSSAASDDELRQVVQRGVFFNADSLSQLARYGDFGGAARVGLRINTGVVTGFHHHVRSGGPTSKFGIHPEQLGDAIALATQRGLRIIGLHTHLGSDIFDIQPPIQALDILIALSEALPDLEFIDVGGGWGVPFMPDDPEFDMPAYGRCVTERMSALSQRRGRHIALRIEPGAYLLSDAGLLLMRVTELKPPVQVNGSVTPYFAGTDSSYNHMVSTVLYDSFHSLWVDGRADALADTTYDVVGNLMQAGDILAKARMLPALREGDLLVMANCGAYAASRAPQFNERPRPAEVFVRGAEALLARRAETVEDLLAHQQW